MNGPWYTKPTEAAFPFGVRYCSRVVRLTWWQSLVWLVRKRQWTRTKVVYWPVRPGEAGWEEAPYEMGLIYGDAEKVSATVLNGMTEESLKKFEHKPDPKIKYTHSQP